MSMAELRTAQIAWGGWRLPERLRCLRQARLRLAGMAREVAGWVTRENLSETLSAEVLPLLDALRYLEQCARRVLRERRVDPRGRPQWLWGTTIWTRPEPLGVVLVIGPSNYPLMLPGIQILQALAAGNAVLVKPAPGCSEPLRRLAGVLAECGLPADLLRVLGEAPADAAEAIAAGVNKVFLTGSAETGRAVMRQLAETGTPSVMELSGCDAVHVLSGADVNLASSAVAFGLMLNDGRTCMAPRRLIVRDGDAERLIRAVCGELTARGASERLLAGPAGGVAAAAVREALEGGARLRLGRLEFNAGGDRLYGPVILDHVRPEMSAARTDLFAPLMSVLRVGDDDEAVRVSAVCPYGLSAAIFGPTSACRAFARRLDVGCVVMNDVIVSTADPRVSFGGRHWSGFGVTRGPAGLLEMTQVKTIVRARPFFRPHLERPTAADADVLEQVIRLEHSPGPLAKLGAMAGIFRAAWKQRVLRSSMNRE
jgi:aldehyde dehydrogenase (NAD+)